MNLNQFHDHNNINNLIEDKIQAYDGKIRYTCKICKQKIITSVFQETHKISNSNNNSDDTMLFFGSNRMINRC